MSLNKLASFPVFFTPTQAYGKEDGFDIIIIFNWLNYQYKLLPPNIGIGV